MKLCSFSDDTGRVRLGLVARDGVRDVTDQVPGDEALSPMRRFIASGTSPETLETRGKPSVIARWLAPVPDPTKVVAAPVNYVDHQAEMSQDVHIDGLGVFLKAPSSLTGHQSVVRLPYNDRRIDQEGELALVIGRHASRVSRQDALGYVAGYTCLLDMTMRGGEDRSLRKSFDTFTPMGPYLVTPNEVGPLEDLSLRTWVGGELRQQGNIADLIWNVPAIISYVSSVMVLEPGDVITTGTPAGVSQVFDGDSIEVEITNVGRLQVSVTDEAATECPTRGRDRGPVPPPMRKPLQT